MDHKEARRYRQQITFNNEGMYDVSRASILYPRRRTDGMPDDIHFPTLTVNQTIKFALRNKVPREREQHLEEKHQYVQLRKHNILDSLGIGHTAKTKVGNEFIRGVSGGERKRVSLAEMMAGHVSTQTPDLTLPSC